MREACTNLAICAGFLIKKISALPLFKKEILAHQTKIVGGVNVYLASLKRNNLTFIAPLRETLKA